MAQEPELQESSDSPTKLPALPDKPNLTEWLESFLPFRLPRIPLPQTAKNLDKSAARLVEAVGINAIARVDSSTSRQNALAKASATFIDLGTNQIEKGTSTELNERALTYVLNEAKLEQRNREAILRVAAEELHDSLTEVDARAEIDEDWLNLFSRFASDKSNADIQRLWGRILAGEIRSPGSIKLRTLSTLSTFDKEDANFAYDVLRQAVNKEFIIAEVINDPGYYEIYLKAHELDLIGTLSSMTVDIQEGLAEVLTIGSVGIAVHAREDASVSFEAYPLTTLGITLCGYIHASEPSPRCFDKLVQQFRKNDLVVWKGPKLEGDGRRAVIKLGEQIWPDFLPQSSPEEAQEP